MNPFLCLPSRLRCLTTGVKLQTKKTSSSKHSPSSNTWIKRQQKDLYVQKARKDGYPSRAIYKLQEMDTMIKQSQKNNNPKNKRKPTLETLNDSLDARKSAIISSLSANRDRNATKNHGLFQKGDIVIELGASPGSWSYYITQRIGREGLLLACDVLPLDPEVLRSVGQNQNRSSKYGSKEGETSKALNSNFPFTSGNFTTQNLTSYSDTGDGISTAVNSNFQFVSGDFTSTQVKHQLITSLEKWYYPNRVQEKILNQNAAIIHLQQQEYSQHNPNDYEHCSSHQSRLLNCRVDSVLSDMAANFTGDRLTDALRTINLCKDALVFAVGESCFDDITDYRYSSPMQEVCTNSPEKSHKMNLQTHLSFQDVGLLRLGGSFLCKFFACGKDHEFDLMQTTKRLFRKSTILKPPASRKESSELYLYAEDFQGTPLLHSLYQQPHHGLRESVLERPL